MCAGTAGPAARPSLLQYLRRRSQKAAQPPGTPVHIGESRNERTRITAFEYDAEGCREHELSGPEDCAAFLDAPRNVWINVDGVQDVTVAQRLGGLFAIHPLIQEDIVSTGQRTKVEGYDGSLFIVLKMLFQEKKGESFRSEQVSVFVRPRLVISFQEQEGDVFEFIRERLRRGTGRVGKRGSDYLAYCLIDAIVDHYFLILEALEDRIEPLEQAVLEGPDPHVMQAIQGVKRELIFLRRTLWPLREMVARLEREAPSLIQKDTLPFLRDVHDHTIQVIEIMESFQEVVSSLMDIYMSSISNRMNGVMKVLTIIATIFIPLTFVAGVYGMNFRVMPELEWRWGYPAVMGGMAVVVAAMLVLFKRKKWL